MNRRAHQLLLRELSRKLSRFDCFGSRSEKHNPSRRGLKVLQAHTAITQRRDGEIAQLRQFVTKAAVLCLLSTIICLSGCCSARTDLPLPPVRYVEPMPMKPQSNAERGMRNAEFSQAVSASPAGRARIHVPAAFAGSAAQQPNHGAGTFSALRNPHSALA